MIKYFPILMVLAWGGFCFAVLFVLSGLIRPKRKSESKLNTRTLNDFSKVRRRLSDQRLTIYTVLFSQVIGILVPLAMVLGRSENKDKTAFALLAFVLALFCLLATLLYLLKKGEIELKAKEN